MARAKQRVEASLDRGARRIVTNAGGLWVKLYPYSEAGLPDRMVLFDGGRMAFVELKAPGGRVGKHQLRTIATLQAMGFRAEVVRSMAQIRALLRVLTTGQGQGHT